MLAWVRNNVGYAGQNASFPGLLASSAQQDVPDVLILGAATMLLHPFLASAELCNHLYLPLQDNGLLLHSLMLPDLLSIILPGCSALLPAVKPTLHGRSIAPAVTLRGGVHLHATSP